MSHIGQSVNEEGIKMNDSERKKSIRLVVAFSFLVTLIAFCSPLLGGSPSAPGLGFIIWGTTPLTVAALIRIVTRDWSDAGLNPAFRKNIKWYVAVVFVCPLLVGCTLLFGAAISSVAVSDFSAVAYLNLVLPGIAIFFIFAIFEEFGWRGFMVPKLAAAGLNNYVAAAVVAVVWTTWHLPYINELTWTYNTTQELVFFIPQYYLLMFAYSILYYELRMITDSIWPCVLLHSLTNAVQHPLAAEYLIIAPGKAYLLSFSGFVMAILVGFLGITLNRWRRRTNRLSKSLV